MTISVYIAAPFSEQENAKKLRDQLAQCGIGCTSRWLEEETSLGKDPPYPMRVLFSRMDRYDVRRAQALVLWNPKSYAEKGTGGRHVESGMALMLAEMPVFIVGAMTNIFAYLPEADHFENSEHVARILAERIKQKCPEFGPTWDEPEQQAWKARKK